MNKKNTYAQDYDLDGDSLYFIPLGGSEQFGVNLNVYASQGQLLAVDCGIGFADEYFPGIDLLLPDPLFLEDNRESLKGLVITHAHEDHVGAVAYLWDRLRCPLYASPFTAAVLRRKLDEEGLSHVKIKTVKPGKKTDIGVFNVEFAPVAHSIPDSCALIINTPQGKVVHSGDWNLDPTPVLGNPTDPKPFQKAGKEGVLAYIGDSTNSEVPGRAGSESAVEKGLESELKGCGGRVLITIFSSNIGRIRSIAKAAERCGRSVCIIGRSLHRMIDAAHECGYLEDIPDFVSEKDIDLVPDDKVVVIATGSQGEYRSALARISRGDYRGFSLKRDDTVIFSARAIPGNEKKINAVKNNLSASGVNIITPLDTEHTIHVSGHPCQDEITDMFGWIKPSIVVPVHGERTQLDAHARLAKGCQISTVIVPNNGSVVKLAPGKPGIIDHVETGLLAVDQKRLVPSDHRSISERRKIQYTGTIHVSLAIDSNGRIVGDPAMNTLGLIDGRDDAEVQIEDRLYDQIFAVMDKLSKAERRDEAVVAEKMRRALRRFANHTLGFKPVTTVHVIQV